jgi:hypothetical protein
LSIYWSINPLINRQSPDRTSKIVCVFLLLSFGLLFFACNSSQAPITKEVVVWKPLGKWSGHNLMQTEAFISDSGSLRIIWETKNETAPGKGVFTVTLHSGVSGRPLLEAVSHQGAGHDVAYVNEDPREFFLVIDAANVDWTVEVSEAFPGQDRSHPNR